MPPVPQEPIARARSNTRPQEVYFKAIAVRMLVISRLIRVLTDKITLWGSTAMRSKLKTRQVRVLEPNSVGENTSHMLRERTLNSADRIGFKADLLWSGA